MCHIHLPNNFTQIEIHAKQHPFDIKKTTSFTLLLHDFDDTNIISLLQTYKQINYTGYKMIDINVCIVMAQFKQQVRINDIRTKISKHFGCTEVLFFPLLEETIYTKYDDIQVHGTYRPKHVHSSRVFHTPHSSSSVVNIVNSNNNSNNITINNINNINIFINPYGFETVKHITNEEWKHMIEEGLKQGLAHLTCKTIEKVHSVPENKNFYIENNATKEVTLIGHNDNKYTMTLEELVNKAPSQYMDIIKENIMDMDPVCTIEKKWNRNQQKSTEAHRIIRTLKNVGIQNFQDIIPNELL
jgi:hypothetical protein